MATAGNIILNLGRTPTGRYVVRPQGRLFAAAKEEDPMKTASGLMTILKQAKGVADMVAPFIGKEYTPPVQQGEIAAQQLDAAQQAAQQLQRTQAIETALATPLPTQVGEMVQPSPVVMRPDISGQLTWFGAQQKQPSLTLTERQQATPGLRLVEPGQEQTMGMPEAAPLDIAALDPAGLQQLMQQQQTLGAQQDIAQAQQAVAEAPPMLPMFNTIADAETAIRSALMLGDFQTVRRMLLGLQYSPLTDIPLATEIGEIPAKQRRQKAIADMMKRLKMPSELTPVRAELERGRQQASLLATEARNKATEQRSEAVAAAGERQKALLAAQKAAAEAAAQAKRDLQTELYEKKESLERLRQKGQRRQAGLRYHFQKKMFFLGKGTATQKQLDTEIRKSEAATKRARTFVENYGAKLPKRPVKQANEKPMDFKRKVDTWEKQTKEFKKQLQLFNYNRLLNARARYIRDWTLEKQNKGKKIPQDILTGDIPNDFYLPELEFPRETQGSQGSQGSQGTSLTAEQKQALEGLVTQ